MSRALAGSPPVAKKQRDAILRLAREQGYVVNATARNLRLPAPTRGARGGSAD